MSSKFFNIHFPVGAVLGMFFMLGCGEDQSDRWSVECSENLSNEISVYDHLLGSCTELLDINTEDYVFESPTFGSEILMVERMKFHHNYFVNQTRGIFETRLNLESYFSSSPVSCLDFKNSTSIEGASLVLFPSRIVSSDDFEQVMFYIGISRKNELGYGGICIIGEYVSERESWQLIFDTVDNNNLIGSPLY
mgnify:CR=1 FL=1